MTAYYVSKQGSDSNSGAQDSPKQTIAAAYALCVNGDSVVVTPDGVYNEQLTLGTGRNVFSLLSSSTKAKPIIDGDNTLDYGIFGNSDNVRNITIDGFEVRNARLGGIHLAAAVISSPTNHLVQNSEVHHVGMSDTTLSEYTPDTVGIYYAYGKNNQTLDNTVHHIGPGGEAIGIWSLWGDTEITTGNTVYACRKDGIRPIYAKNPQLWSNLVFDCWSGLTLEYFVGGMVIDNMVYDCSYGIYPKQINDDTHTPNVRTTWGGGTTPIDPAWVYVFQNTAYRCSECFFAPLAGGSAPGDYMDIENNIWVPGPNGGASYILDGDNWRGTNWVQDHNLYGTPAGVAPHWYYLRRYLYADAANQSTLAGLQTQTGWEANGMEFDPELLDLKNGHLDYPNSSPAHLAGADLTSKGSPFGKRMGARGLRGTSAVYRPGPLGALDSASSASQAGLTAAKLVDENDETYWETATHSGSAGVGIDEWAIIDLGAPTAFDHVTQIVYSHEQPYNPKTISLEVSDDKTTWTNLSESPGIVGFPFGASLALPDSEGSSYKFELAELVTARYLRYTIVDAFGDEYGVSGGVQVGRIVPARAYRGRARRRRPVGGRGAGVVRLPS